MKKFLKKLLLFILTNLVCIIIIILLFENSSLIKERNQNSFLNRHNITFQKIKNYDGKKIIFLGGSNLAFGLDSKRIQEKLGIKTFNFGVHGGISLKKSIDSISRYITKNDIIIISPEYVSFNLHFKQDVSDYVDFLSGFNLIESFNLEKTKKYINFLKNNLKGLIFTRDSKLYSNKSFNENGDFIAHHDLQTKFFLLPKEKNLIREDSLIVFKKFIEKKFRETQYFIFPPPTINEYFTKQESHENNANLTKIFEEKYPLNIESFSYNYNCFFDSYYHLNYECKKDRTKVILEFLQSLNFNNKN